MAKSRVVKRDSVFVTDSETLVTYRFERGQKIPEKYTVGDHVFTDEPDLAGTPQTGSFGRVLPFEAEPDAPATPASEGGEYDPNGNVEDIVAYVGDDPDRARAALEAEKDGKNRPTLIEKLEKVAGPAQ